MLDLLRLYSLAILSSTQQQQKKLPKQAHSETHGCKFEFTMRLREGKKMERCRPAHPPPRWTSSALRGLILELQVINLLCLDPLAILGSTQQEQKISQMQGHSETA